MATGRIPTTANSPLTAKGDIFTYSTGSAKLAVGNDGETIVADSSTSTGLRYQATSAAGKNAIINGAFDIWQRGTSIAINSSFAYTADRWTLPVNASQTATVSRQATGDTTNLPTIQYCARVQRNSGSTGTGGMGFVQTFENANSTRYVGQAVTLSFYARKGANYSPTGNALTIYGISGTGTDQSRANGTFTGEAYWVNNQTATLTSTWQRFTFSGTVASSATQIAIYFGLVPTGTAGANDYFEITGVQLELGSTATTFSRAGGTIQGELAACQRYYQRPSNTSIYAPYGYGSARSTTQVDVLVSLPVSMRVAPTAVDYATLTLSIPGVAAYAISALTLDSTHTNSVILLATSTGLTQYRMYLLNNSNSTSGYLGLTAEL